MSCLAPPTGAGEVGIETCDNLIGSDHFANLLLEMGDIAKPFNKAEHVSKLVACWREFKVGLENKGISNVPDSCHQLLRYTAATLVDARYSSKVETSLKSELKNAIKDLSLSFGEKFPSLANYCSSLSSGSLCTDPWNSEEFRNVRELENLKALETERGLEKIEALWNAEGWLILEARLEILGKPKKISMVDMMEKILNIFILKGKMFYPASDDIENDKIEFHPLQFSFQKYVEYLEVYILLWRKLEDLVDLNTLRCIPVEMLPDVIGSLRDKAKAPDKGKGIVPRLWQTNLKELVHPFLIKVLLPHPLSLDNCDIYRLQIHLRSLFRIWLELFIEGKDEGSDLQKSLVEAIQEFVKITKTSKISLYLYALSEVIFFKFNVGVGEQGLRILLLPYLHAMTLDVNMIEEMRNHQKTDRDTKKLGDEYKNLSARFLQLADYLQSCPLRTKDLILTAFSLNPTEQLFGRLFLSSPPLLLAPLQNSSEERTQEEGSSPNASQPEPTSLLIPPDLNNTLDSIIKNPRWGPLRCRWKDEEELKRICTTLLKGGNNLLIEQKVLKFAHNVNYDDYKHLPSQYGGDDWDDQVERGFYKPGAQPKICVRGQIANKFKGLSNNKNIGAKRFIKHHNWHPQQTIMNKKGRCFPNFTSPSTIASKQGHHLPNLRIPYIENEDADVNEEYLLGSVRQYANYTKKMNKYYQEESCNQSMTIIQKHKRRIKDQSYYRRRFLSPHETFSDNKLLNPYPSVYSKFPSTPAGKRKPKKGHRMRKRAAAYVTPRSIFQGPGKKQIEDFDIDFRFEKKTISSLFLKDKLESYAFSAIKDTSQVSQQETSTEPMASTSRSSQDAMNWDEFKRTRNICTTSSIKCKDGPKLMFEPKVVLDRKVDQVPPYLEKVTLHYLGSKKTAYAANKISEEAKDLEIKHRWATPHLPRKKKIQYYNNETRVALQLQTLKDQNVKKEEIKRESESNASPEKSIVNPDNKENSQASSSLLKEDEDDVADKTLEPTSTLAETSGFGFGYIFEVDLCRKKIYPPPGPKKKQMEFVRDAMIMDAIDRMERNINLKTYNWEEVLDIQKTDDLATEKELSLRVQSKFLELSLPPQKVLVKQRRDMEELGKNLILDAVPLALTASPAALKTFRTRVRSISSCSEEPGESDFSVSSGRRRSAAKRSRTHLSAKVGYDGYNKALDWLDINFPTPNGQLFESFMAPESESESTGVYKKRKYQYYPDHIINKAVLAILRGKTLKEAADLFYINKSALCKRLQVKGLRKNGVMTVPEELRKMLEIEEREILLNEDDEKPKPAKSKPLPEPLPEPSPNKKWKGRRNVQYSQETFDKAIGAIVFGAMNITQSSSVHQIPRSTLVFHIKKLTDEGNIPKLENTVTKSFISDSKGSKFPIFSDEKDKEKVRKALKMIDEGSSVERASASCDIKLEDLNYLLESLHEGECDYTSTQPKKRKSGESKRVGKSPRKGSDLGRETLRRDLSLGSGVADGKIKDEPNSVDSEPKEPEKPKFIISIPFLRNPFVKSTSERVSGKPLYVPVIPPRIIQILDPATGFMVNVPDTEEISREDEIINALPPCPFGLETIEPEPSSEESKAEKEAEDKMFEECTRGLALAPPVVVQVSTLNLQQPKLFEPQVSSQPKSFQLQPSTSQLDTNSHTLTFSIPEKHVEPQAKVFEKTLTKECFIRLYTDEVNNYQKTNETKATMPIAVVDTPAATEPLKPSPTLTVVTNESVKRSERLQQMPDVLDFKTGTVKKIAKPKPMSVNLLQKSKTFAPIHVTDHIPSTSTATIEAFKGRRRKSENDPLCDSLNLSKKLKVEEEISKDEAQKTVISELPNEKSSPTSSVVNIPASALPNRHQMKPSELKTKPNQRRKRQKKMTKKNSKAKTLRKSNESDEDTPISSSSDSENDPDYVPDGEEVEENIPIIHSIQSIPCQLPTILARNELTIAVPMTFGKKLTRAISVEDDDVVYKEQPEPMLLPRYSQINQSQQLKCVTKTYPSPKRKTNEIPVIIGLQQSQQAVLKGAAKRKRNSGNLVMMKEPEIIHLSDSDTDMKEEEPRGSPEQITGDIIEDEHSILADLSVVAEDNKSYDSQQHIFEQFKAAQAMSPGAIIPDDGEDSDDTAPLPSSIPKFGESQVTFLNILQQENESKGFHKSPITGEHLINNGFVTGQELHLQKPVSVIVVPQKKIERTIEDELEEELLGMDDDENVVESISTPPIDKGVETRPAYQEQPVTVKESRKVTRKASDDSANVSVIYPFSSSPIHFQHDQQETIKSLSPISSSKLNGDAEVCKEEKELSEDNDGVNIHNPNTANESFDEEKPFNNENNEQLITTDPLEPENIDDIEEELKNMEENDDDDDDTSYESIYSTPSPSPAYSPIEGFSNSPIDEKNPAIILAPELKREENETPLSQSVEDDYDNLPPKLSPVQTLPAYSEIVQQMSEMFGINEESIPPPVLVKEKYL